MPNYQFWFYYLLFVLSPRRTNARFHFSKKMAHRVTTFTHCSLILSPLTDSKALSKRHWEVFAKALNLATNYDQALCLCNWGYEGEEKKKAYNRMLELTPANCSYGHAKEVIHEYGILLKIPCIYLRNEARLLDIRAKLDHDDQIADKFIKGLKAYSPGGECYH